MADPNWSRLRAAWRVLRHGELAYPLRWSALGAAVDSLIDSGELMGTLTVHADGCQPRDLESEDCACGPTTLAIVKHLTAEDVDRSLARA